MDIREALEIFRDPEVLSVAKRNFVLETVKGQLIQAAGVDRFLMSGSVSQQLVGESLFFSAKYVADLLFKHMLESENKRFRFVRDNNDLNYVIPVELSEEFEVYRKHQGKWTGTPFTEYAVHGPGSITFENPLLG